MLSVFNSEIRRIASIAVISNNSQDIYKMGLELCVFFDIHYSLQSLSDVKLVGTVQLYVGGLTGMEPFLRILRMTGVR